jgi:TetR/AcrR family transcriptional repressor of nem operon
MPWEKKFDETEALDKAMLAFWAHGFEATSVQDLVDCMGLNRGSIYAAFGGKRQLFLRALSHYESSRRRAWLEALKRDHSPRAAILALFQGAIGAALSDPDRSGCFLINTAIELSPHDEEIAETVAAGLSETEAFFHALIVEGQSAGEIPDHVDPLGTARTLLGLLAGLRVLARSRPERALLETLSRQAAALLA